MTHAQGQPAAAPPVRTEVGFGLFQQRCLGCHGNPAFERAPPPRVLREIPPERILEALTTGVMSAVGATLSETERRLVAESVAGRLIGTSQSGRAEMMPNRCPSKEPMADPAAGPAWNGWGAGSSNARFQPAAAAGLDAASVSRLKLKWAFGYPGGTSAYGQPSIVSGRIFVGTDTGFVYALDAKTGCVYWSFQTKAGVRNAMTIGPLRANGAAPGTVRYAVYFGDVKANVYALDAQTGAEVWSAHVEDHYTGRVTAAPALYDGRLYVPLSSWEEFSARSLDYPCCTSVGSIVALDASTGAQLWKTYVIPERPKPTVKNAKGVQQWAPAGGSVWNTPTIDPWRRAIYFGTGDATTFPAAKTSDAVMALDMDTGKVLWFYQVHENDTYLVGCVGENRTENCPKVQGPIGTSRRPSSCMRGRTAAKRSSWAPSLETFWPSIPIAAHHCGGSTCTAPSSAMARCRQACCAAGFNGAVPPMRITAILASPAAAWRRSVSTPASGCGSRR
jgi:polyvinyl alcohol dehydrogenase (cytochrome)